MEIVEGIWYMLWRGLAIGVIISAPMGPVGILCVQRTLEKGRRTGFFTGVGAAISDLFYCLLTGFGLSFIEDFLKANQDMIQIIGSAVLIIFGVYLFRSNPARTLKKPEEQRVSKRKTILSGFLFTFSNPLIIFLIIGLFARFNFLLPEIAFGHYVVGFVFIFVGALLWWWVVSYFIDKVRTHFNLRSMWLINKITGSIIMIFGAVGAITAITNIANASGREGVYLNSYRGFGSIDRRSDREKTDGTPLVIGNNGCDTVIRTIPGGNASEFTFSFRLENRHDRSGKRYGCCDGRKVTNPGWGIRIYDGHRGDMTFCVRTIDDIYDSQGLVRLHVEAVGSSGIITEKELTGGVSTGGWNSYRIKRKGDSLFFMAGNREYMPIVGLSVSDLVCDSIGFMVSPGGEIAVDYISYEAEPGATDRERTELSHFGQPEVRRSYFARSLDRREGEWVMFDRMLDDDLLRPGGMYRVAMVSDGRGGYDLVYISGASANADKWQPGMLKAKLKATEFCDTYDVEWYDPSMKRLRGDIKAQFEGDELVTLQFPEHNGSKMRLRKVPLSKRQDR